ncbi:MAG: hypothetical protein PVI54_03165 [Desulfobacteraceae bacterium]|jgi:exodeoxyribonuclease V alpha subunit
MIASKSVACFCLTKIFRQAEQSLIIKYAHQINRGDIPRIDSPFKKPHIWQNGNDCLFLDSDAATQEQLNFVFRVKRFFDLKNAPVEKSYASGDDDLYEFRVSEPVVPYETELTIPKKFQHCWPCSSILGPINNLEDRQLPFIRLNPF